MVAASLHAKASELARAAPVSARRGRAAWPLFVAAPPALALVLFAHGIWPGAVGDAPTAYLAEGAIRCVHDIGRFAFTTSCQAYGQPLGYPLLTDGPVIFLGSVLLRLPGVELSGAYALSGALLDAVALAGGYGLARRLGMGRAVALWVATLYLVSPTILGLVSFIGTFGGFALLPAYALADLKLLELLGRSRSRRWMAATFAAYAGVRVISLFLDGYSFVASALVSGCLWAAWALSRDLGLARRRWIGLIAIVAANGVAYALYQAYVPGDYPPSPADFIRAMGLDVVTLVEPTARFWIPDVLGLTWDHTRLWGDGSNVAFNYVGISCVILAGVALALRAGGRYGVALACAGAIALVLSLGPSLKVADARPSSTTRPTYESYLMPASAADASLPWGSLLTRAPGLQSMRGAYRWFGVSRLALVLVAGLAVDALARRRRRWLVVAVVAAGVVTLELLPNLPLVSRSYRAQAQQVSEVGSTVGSELRSVTRPYERAFFLNYDGTHNDYMVNYLAAAATLRAYNAGGDKDAFLAAQRWPPAVTALASAAVTPDAVAAALASRTVDVVIAPDFHLRWNAYAWPPQPAEERQAAKAFRPILDDRRFHVDRRRWLAAIRLARPGG